MSRIKPSALLAREKAQLERPIEEMTYESRLKWRYMKKMRSETEARHWHVKVEGDKFDENNNPILEDYNILQVRVPRRGERLICYRATKSGRPIELSTKYVVFDKIGIDHLHGIEYLLRVLEGQDISDLRLDQE